MYLRLIRNDRIRWPFSKRPQTVNYPSSAKAPGPDCARARPPIALHALHNPKHGLLAIAFVIVAGAVLGSCHPSGGYTSENADTSTPAKASPTRVHIEPPRRILFIGNSLTYYNGGVDVHLLKLLRAAKPKVNFVVESVVYPNRTVTGHFEDRGTHERILQNRWDVVIVQGASYEALSKETVQDFLTGIGDLAGLAHAIDADLALFMTWAFRSAPEMTNRLVATYVTAGNETGALVVPVGMAWQHARATGLSIGLYADDRHPSRSGTYLAACVFYSALFGESAVGNTYTAGLAMADAARLQEIAWTTVSDFYAQGSGSRRSTDSKAGHPGAATTRTAVRHVAVFNGKSG